MDLMLGALIEFVFLVIFVATGRLAVHAVSFGRWRGAHDSEGVVHSAGGALWFRRDGQVVLTDLSLGFLGFLVVLVAVSVVTWLAFHASSR